MAVDFLYWNIHARQAAELKPAVGAHIAREAPSILILSEVPPHLFDALPGLITQAVGTPMVAAGTPNPTRNLVIVRQDAGLQVHGYRGAHGGRVGFYKVRDDAFELLLVTVHLKDALHNSEMARYSYAQGVSRTICEVEQDVGHRRTIVIGDFNMNPFDVGMTAADGFNAVSDRTIARGTSRGMHGVQYPFFYNPSWRLLGDEPHPAGSYCWGTNDGTRDYWHLLDQVLIRSDILSTHHLSLAISSEETIRTRNGRPHEAMASDHFPLRIGLRSQP